MRLRGGSARRGTTRRPRTVAACTLAVVIFALALLSLSADEIAPPAPCPIASCNLTAYCVARGGAGVALAYNNAGMQDGAGSQLHRVVLAHALSRAVSAGYVHARLLALDLHGDSPAIIDDWNALFHLSDTGTLNCEAEGDVGAAWRLGAARDGCAHVRLGHKIVWSDVLRAVSRECAPAPPALFMRLRAASRTPPRVVVHLGAAELFDAAPELLARSAAHFSSDLPWLLAAHTNSAMQTTALCASRDALYVGVHVRRGDVVTAADRRVPNEYFLGMARILTDAALALSLPPLRVHFFMDAVTPGGEAALALDDFARVAGATLHYGGGALETLRALARADILVMSRSSFSFLPALLHDADRGAVVYHPMWHAPRADWFVAEPWVAEAGMGNATNARLAKWLGTRRTALCG